jgi:ATP-dependent Zn protease
MEQDMADAAHHHCTRPWYLRPPVLILGVVLLGLAAFGIVQMSSRPAVMSYGDFFDQLDAGNVASVTFQGTQVNGRFKHAIVTPAAKGAASQDTFRSQVPDIGDRALLPELRKQHVAIDVVSSSSWISWLGRLPWPMLVILVVILVVGLVRLKRGGTAPSDTAMPMHPMQQMTGLVSGMFGKQSGPPSDSIDANSQSKA